MSSFTFPVRTVASPTTFRIAVVSIAGVASAGRSVSTGTAPSTAAPPARFRNWRRVVSGGWCMFVFLFAQRGEIRHDVFDLFGRQDRLAAPGRADTIKAVDPIIGRHDGRGIEAGRIHEPEPKLAFGPAAAGTRKVRRQIALELLFGKWAAVAEDASAGTFDDEGAPAGRVTARIRERLRHGVADDGVGLQRLPTG